MNQVEIEVFKKASFKKEAFSFFCFLFLSVLFLTGSNFFIKPKEVKRSDYLVPPAIIENLLSGLKIQAADSFWFRSLQDFDFCDVPINNRECKGKSWLYEILNLTTDLDKNFYEAYYYGGLALTVIISDYEGASKIFDKGVATHPNQWRLTYAAGYHSLFEEKNKAKASNLFLMTSKNGGPKWLSTLAAKLLVDSGEKEAAKAILEEMIASNEDPKLTDHLKKRLEDLEKDSSEK